MSDIIQQITEAIASIDENDPSAASVYREDLADARAALMGNAAEIERCHARLEIDRLWHCRAIGGSDEAGNLSREEIPMSERGDFPDGITCRDETIKMLMESIKRHEARVAAFRADVEDAG